jgi:hypothetical protein
LKGYVKQVGAPGLEFIDEGILARQRSVLSYMIKTAGMNILEGKSIMNISLPINISDYRSVTEVFAFQTRIHEFFLEYAASEKPEERIKIVMTHFVAGMHFQMAYGKPFNPIVGETFQSKSGNSYFYAEQTSHHPPVNNFYIVNKEFKYYGYVSPEAKASPNSVLATIKGKFQVDYNDGTKYKITFPKIHMIGLLAGKRYINFEEYMKIEDTVIFIFNLDKRFNSVRKI